MKVNPVAVLFILQADGVGVGYGLDHHLAASGRLDRDRAVVIGDADHGSRPNGVAKVFLFLLFLGGGRSTREGNGEQDHTCSSASP